jgi:ribosomal protein S11
MAHKVKLWLDPEADYLEVVFSDAPGYMKETDNESVMERVDAEGNVIGFSVQGISQFKNGHPLNTELTA